MHPNEQQAEDLKQHARHEGARVGRLALPNNLNPYQPEDPLYAEWRRGWDLGTNELARRAA
jgi:hypothetical protein